MDLAQSLNKKAYELNKGRYSSHHRKIILQYEHQEICRGYLSEGKITRDEYDCIIATMSGQVTKI